MTSLTEDQFKRLLETIVVSKEAPQKEGSFAQCTARYDGTRETSRVNEFITVTSIYRRCEHISDEKALEELPLLLQGFASTWWQGIKEKATTWEEATNLLREAFAPRRPPYKVYMDLFSRSQDARTPTDVFLGYKRALLTELPTDSHTESQQMDLIFGLLHPQIRTHIRREKMNTFEDLLKRARTIEENRAEKPLRDKEEKTTGDTQKTEHGARPRCSYCKKFGHRQPECRKRTQDMGTTARPKSTEVPESAKENVPPGTPSIFCYGCNRPGVIRSKCPDCSKRAPSQLSFCSINPRLNATTLKERPALRISIQNQEGTAYVDTGARISVASYELYVVLRRLGYSFTPLRTTLILADGQQREQTVLFTDVTIYLAGRQVLTSFIVLPEATTNKTLLGVDFIHNANLVLDLRQDTWYFGDQPETKYHFFQKENEDSSHLPKSEPMDEAVDLDLIQAAYQITPAISPLPSTPEQPSPEDGLDAYGPDILRRPRTPPRESCMKTVLTTEPVLRQADFTQPFTLRTDASNYALGAVLLQGEPPPRSIPSNMQAICSPHPKTRKTPKTSFLVPGPSPGRLPGPEGEIVTPPLTHPLSAATLGRCDDYTYAPTPGPAV